MYVLGNTTRQKSRYSDRSVGNLHPSITSTTGTCLLSCTIDATSGGTPSEPTTTTRCSGVEVVPSRSEANRVNSSIEPSVVTQSRNASVFSKGQCVGFGNRVKRTCDTFVQPMMTSTSREGKDDRWISVGMGGARFSRRNSRMLSKASGGNSLKTFFKRKEPRSVNLPSGPDNRMICWEDRYSMEMGDARFGRCAVETPDKRSASSSSSAL